MAFDVLKQYKIKIGAETKDFLTALNDLEKDASKKLKDLGLNDGLRHDIELLVQEVGTMRKLLDSTTDEIRGDFTTITSTVDELAIKMDALHETMRLFGEGGIENSTKSISDSFKTLSDNISEVVGQFKTTYEMIEQIQSGKISSSIFDGIVSGGKDASSSIDKIVDNLIKSIKRLNDIKDDNSLFDALDADLISREELQETKQIVDNVVNNIKELQKLKNEGKTTIDIGSILSTHGTNMGELDDFIAGLRKQLAKTKQNIEQVASKNGKKDPTEVRFRYVIEEPDNAAVNSMVEKIKDNVIKDIQRKINNNPIRIPIGYKADASLLVDESKINPNDIKAQERLNKKIETLDESTTADHLVKSINVKIEADTEGLSTKINNEIIKINDNIRKSGKKIEVEVVGKVDRDTVYDSVDDISDALKKNMASGNVGNVNLSGGFNIDGFNIATEDTLSQIKNILIGFGEKGKLALKKTDIVTDDTPLATALPIDKFDRNKYINVRWGGRELDADAKRELVQTESLMKNLYRYADQRKDYNELWKAVNSKNEEEALKAFKNSKYYQQKIVKRDSSGNIIRNEENEPIYVADYRGYDADGKLKEYSQLDYAEFQKRSEKDFLDMYRQIAKVKSDHDAKVTAILSETGNVEGSAQWQKDLLELRRKKYDDITAKIYKNDENLIRNSDWNLLHTDDAQLREEDLKRKQYVKERMKQAKASSMHGATDEQIFKAFEEEQKAYVSQLVRNAVGSNGKIFSEIESEIKSGSYTLTKDDTKILKEYYAKERTAAVDAIRKPYESMMKYSEKQIKSTKESLRNLGIDFRTGKWTTDKDGNGKYEHSTYDAQKGTYVFSNSNKEVGDIIYRQGSALSADKKEVNATVWNRMTNLQSQYKDEIDLINQQTRELEDQKEVLLSMVSLKEKVANAGKDASDTDKKLLSDLEKSYRVNNGLDDSADIYADVNSKLENLDADIKRREIDAKRAANNLRANKLAVRNELFTEKQWKNFDAKKAQAELAELRHRNSVFDRLKTTYQEDTTTAGTGKHQAKSKGQGEIDYSNLTYLENEIVKRNKKRIELLEKQLSYYNHTESIYENMYERSWTGNDVIRVETEDDKVKGKASIGNDTNSYKINNHAISTDVAKILFNEETKGKRFVDYTDGQLLDRFDALNALKSQLTDSASSNTEDAARGKARAIVDSVVMELKDAYLEGEKTLQRYKDRLFSIENNDSIDEQERERQIKRQKKLIEEQEYFVQGLADDIKIVSGDGAEQVLKRRADEAKAKFDQSIYGKIDSLEEEKAIIQSKKRSYVVNSGNKELSALYENEEKARKEFDDIQTELQRYLRNDEASVLDKKSFDKIQAKHDIAKKRLTDAQLDVMAYLSLNEDGELSQFYAKENELSNQILQKEGFIEALKKGELVFDDSDEGKEAAKYDYDYRKYTDRKEKLVKARENYSSQYSDTKNILTALYDSLPQQSKDGEKVSLNKFLETFHSLQAQYGDDWNQKEIKDALISSGLLRLYEDGSKQNNAKKEISNEALSKIKSSTQEALKPYENVQSFYDKQVANLTASIMASSDVSDYIEPGGIIDKELAAIERVIKARQEDADSKEQHYERINKINTQAQKEYEEKHMAEFAAAVEEVSSSDSKDQKVNSKDLDAEADSLRNQIAEIKDYSNEVEAAQSKLDNARMALSQGVGGVVFNLDENADETAEYRSALEKSEEIKRSILDLDNKEKANLDEIAEQENKISLIRDKIESGKYLLTNPHEVPFNNDEEKNKYYVPIQNEIDENERLLAVETEKLNIRRKEIEENNKLIQSERELKQAELQTAEANISPAFTSSVEQIQTKYWKEILQYAEQYENLSRSITNAKDAGNVELAEQLQLERQIAKNNFKNSMGNYLAIGGKLQEDSVPRNVAELYGFQNKSSIKDIKVGIQENLSNIEEYDKQEQEIVANRAKRQKEIERIESLIGQTKNKDYYYKEYNPEKQRYEIRKRTPKLKDKDQVVYTTESTTRRSDEYKIKLSKKLQKQRQKQLEEDIKHQVEKGGGVSLEEQLASKKDVNKKLFEREEKRLETIAKNKAAANQSVDFGKAVLELESKKSDVQDSIEQDASNVVQSLKNDVEIAEKEFNEVAEQQKAANEEKEKLRRKLAEVEKEQRHSFKEGTFTKSDDELESMKADARKLSGKNQENEILKINEMMKSVEYDGMTDYQRKRAAETDVYIQKLQEVVPELKKQEKALESLQAKKAKFEDGKTEDEIKELAASNKQYQEVQENINKAQSEYNKKLSQTVSYWEKLQTARQGGMEAGLLSNKTNGRLFLDDRTDEEKEDGEKIKQPKALTGTRYSTIKDYIYTKQGYHSSDKGYINPNDPSYDYDLHKTGESIVSDEDNKKLEQRIASEHKLYKARKQYIKQGTSLKAQWRIAGMTDDEAEVAMAISKANAQLKNRKKLTIEQKAALQEELKLLYQRIEAEKMSLEINEAGYVKEKVSYQDFKKDPTKYATNEMLKGMIAYGSSAGSYKDYSSITDLRGATESTLQNIQHILSTGVKVKIIDSINGKKQYYTGLNALPDKRGDVDPYAYLNARSERKQQKKNWKNYNKNKKKKDWSKKDFGYSKMTDSEKALYDEYNEIRKQLKTVSDKDRKKLEARKKEIVKEATGGDNRLQRSEKTGNLYLPTKGKVKTDQSQVKADTKQVKENTEVVKENTKAKQANNKVDNKSKKSKQIKQSDKSKQTNVSNKTPETKIDDVVNDDDSVLSSEETKAIYEQTKNITDKIENIQNKLNVLESNPETKDSDEAVGLRSELTEAESMLTGINSKMESKIHTATPTSDTKSDSFVQDQKEEEQAVKENNKAIDEQIDKKYSLKQINNYIKNSKSDEKKDHWRQIARNQGLEIDANGYAKVKQQIEQVEESQEQLNAETAEYINLQEKVEPKGLKGALDITKTTSKMKDGTSKVKYNIKDIYGNTAVLDQFGNVIKSNIKTGTEDTSKKATEIKKLMSSIGSTLDDKSINNIRGYLDGLLPEGEVQKVHELRDAYNKLKTVFDSYEESLKNGEIINYTDKQLEDFEKLRSEINKIKIDFTGETQILGTFTNDQVKPDKLQANLRNVAREYENASIANVKFSNSNQEMTYQLVDSNRMLNTYKLTVAKTGEVTRELVKSEKYLTSFQKLGHAATRKFGEIFNYMVASTSIYEVFNFFRRGLTIVKEMDTALTEMNKVYDGNIEKLQQYQKESFKLASAVGTTGQQIQTSTADWLRLGESLEEASKSAQAANILFNVSEFESIDQATESLVAMSSAYSDLDKMDIVDKLNHIGNEYPIATDGLATALQKSASALLTSGNTIDEAIALVTAGNAVVQDPDSVGAGIRTISLRIAGTEAAKAELEELGEDTEDFVVQTKAKSQEAIKDFTSVASNNFEGFDILDDNGNFKSTYEILLGIAEIYDEIVASDKQFGTNKANGLLETLAGKNRANIAASIIQNEDILRSVYKDSQDSEGSALQENEKFLNSIEGHIQQITNKWQELWANSANRDVINFFIDLGGHFLDFINMIGMIPTAGIVGAALWGLKGKAGDSGLSHFRTALD